MTDQQHPTTPSDELVMEWINKHYGGVDRTIATQSARWGADQELEACCEWLRNSLSEELQEVAQELRNARRPKPPSLKEQALQAFYRFDDTEGHEGLTQEQIAEDFVIIRRALESLPTCQHPYHA